MTSHQQRERGRARPAQAAPRRTPTSPGPAQAEPTCASASCYCVFKTEKTSVVGYFIAKYAKMPFSTVTLQVVYNEINHLSY